MKDIIRIRNLDYAYSKEKVFSSFSMNIKEGSFISIVGPNKSGKTTLIKLMSGLIVNKDQVILGYHFLTKNHLSEAAIDLGVVLSDIENKFLHDEVYDELAFPLENLNCPPKTIKKRILEVSEQIGITDLLDKRIERLTSVQKRKLFFAIALLHHPKVLLLDNPFVGLTDTERRKMTKFLKKLNEQENTTIVLTSNQLIDALDSDYLYILNQGQIAIEGKPLVVMKEDQLLTKIGLELPFMVDLSLKLQFYEIFDKIELDLDRMVHTLWK